MFVINTIEDSDSKVVTIQHGLKIEVRDIIYNKIINDLT